MYNYTYRLTIDPPQDEQSLYIGVRSSECYPTEDVKYLGSSKTLTNLLRNNSAIKVVKEVLAIWGSRELANEHEIRLHDYFDVAKNKLFFNLSKAVNKGFYCDQSHTEDTKNHLSKVHQERNAEMTEDALKSLYGRKHSQEVIDKTQATRKATIANMTPEERKLKFNGSANRHQVHSEETKAKMSITRKLWWAKKKEDN
jgi:hypothetical protein